jgi:hypothetical protein
MEHVLPQYISGSIEKSTNLPGLEQDLARFHTMMSLKDINGWEKHVMDTLHQGDQAKVML